MSVTTLFPKGKSGNPGGMTSEYQRLAKDFKYECAREAYKRLPLMLQFIDSEDVPPNIRVNALNALLDRGFGKAVQTVIMDNEADSKPAHMLTKSELDSYLAGEAVSTFKSMVQRGEPALLEAMNLLAQPVAKNNPSDGSSNCEKVINDIAPEVSNIVAIECDNDANPCPDKKKE